jgi:hypothetical protein
MKGDEDNKNIYFSIPHISVKHFFFNFFVSYVLIHFACLCFISGIEIVVQNFEHFWLLSKVIR